jgi:hypothetical protein
MEKLVRIYDLERPDAAPQQLSGAAKGIRNVVWVHGDSLVLTTQQDTPGLDVWDVRSGSIVQTLATEAPVTSVEVGARAGPARGARDCRRPDGGCPAADGVVRHQAAGGGSEAQLLGAG